MSERNDTDREARLREVERAFRAVELVALEQGGPGLRRLIGHLGYCIGYLSAALSESTPTEGAEL